MHIFTTNKFNLSSLYQKSLSLCSAEWTVYLSSRTKKQVASFWLVRRSFFVCVRYDPISFFFALIVGWMRWRQSLLNQSIFLTRDQDFRICTLIRSQGRTSTSVMLARSLSNRSNSLLKEWVNTATIASYDTLCERSSPRYGTIL